MEEKRRKLTFHLFRYQINPISKTFQLDHTHPDISSMDELIRKKNDVFAGLFTEPLAVEHARAELTSRIERVRDRMIFLHVAVKKNVTLSTKDFSKAKAENWPSTYVIIDTRPDFQLVLIQKHSDSLPPESLAEALERSLSKSLLQHQLHLKIMPLFEKRDFWSIIREHPKDLTQITFEFIRPNLSNISRTLAHEIKDFTNNTNTEVAKLELNSPPESSLEIDESDEQINSLVNYSAAGGGGIKVEMARINIRYTTKESTRSTVIDQLTLQAQDAHQIAQIIEASLTHGHSEND